MAGRNGLSGQYSVSLYPIDAAVLAEVQEAMHLNTLSGALQYVIRRYAEQNGVEGRARLVKGGKHGGLPVQEQEREPAAV